MTMITKQQEQKVFAHDPKTGLRLRESSQIEKELWEKQEVRHHSFRKGILVGDVIIDQEQLKIDGILDQGVSD